MKILIVEDEALLAESLCTLLTGRGFAVDTAADGVTGAEYARTGVYDLVILDVMLPGMDGLAVARLLRAARCGTPILMLTARGELDDRVAGLMAGGRGAAGQCAEVRCRARHGHGDAGAAARALCAVGGQSRRADPAGNAGPSVRTVLPGRSGARRRRLRAGAVDRRGGRAHPRRAHARRERRRRQHVFIELDAL